ncbi:MAG: hypothetical protein GEU99_17455 [Luteitalea sp.]|nr:hypothetical protein [Luteitalea sp.]
MGTSAGLARLEDERFTVYTTRDGLPDDYVRSLSWDREHALWIGTARAGVSRFADGRFARYGVEDGLANARVRVVYHDRDGTLWIGTEGSGLYRFQHGRFAAYTASDGLPGNRVLSIYQDPDGDLWIGTNGNGLARLRDPQFRSFAADDGLAGQQVAAVYGDAAGGLWMGTDAGLSRFDRGTFATYTAKDGLPDLMVRTISEDRAGSLWLGSGNGLWRLTGHRVTHWSSADGLSSNNVYAVLADRQGNVWIGTMTGGLNKFRDGRFTTYTTRDGLPDNDIVSLYEDRAGSLWIGTRSGGLSRLDDGRFTTWSTSDGLSSNHVLSFYEDTDGALWVGTHGGGLTRFKHGRLATVTTKDGLYDNLAFRILEDDTGDLWMSGNRGIYRASLRELNDVADGRIRSVSSFAYGVGDGMLSRECNGANPGGWKTADGRLWFPTVKGVVSVDPTRRNERPPLVAIEAVTIDRELVPAGQPVRITPGRQTLEIEYTALSWKRPQHVRFKYQLAGLEDTWVDAGTRRTASYSRLSPGRYTFTVIADNGDGVWNLEGQILAVTVVPAFYQTTWFVALVSLAVAGAIAFAWRSRVRQLQHAQAAQQAFSAQLIASQEGERKRIAAELHDSLGQSLLVIKNQAALEAEQHRGGQASRRFTEIGDLVSLTIDEVRTISWNLRPSHLDQLGLRTALIVMIEKLAAVSGIAIEHEIDACDDVLPPDDQIIVYRIIQECLNNVVKHARAATATVTIRRDGQALEIGVRDNGHGFVSRPSSSTPLGHGGFGLTGIAERVRMLGGTHTMTSSPGEGTTVHIRIALRGPTGGTSP